MKTKPEKNTLIKKGAYRPFAPLPWDIVTCAGISAKIVMTTVLERG